MVCNEESIDEESMLLRYAERAPMAVKAVTLVTLTPKQC